MNGAILALNGAILAPSVSIKKQTVDLVPGRLLEEPTDHVRPGCTTRASGQSAPPPHRLLPQPAFQTSPRGLPGLVPHCCARSTGATGALTRTTPAPGRDGGGSGLHALSCGAVGIWPSSGLAWAAPGLSRLRGASSLCISANTLAPRIFINFICFPDIKSLLVFFLAPSVRGLCILGTICLSCRHVCVCCVHMRVMCDVCTHGPLAVHCQVPL